MSLACLIGFVPSGYRPPDPAAWRMKSAWSSGWSCLVRQPGLLPQLVRGVRALERGAGIARRPSRDLRLRKHTARPLRARPAPRRRAARTATARRMRPRQASQRGPRLSARRPGHGRVIPEVERLGASRPAASRARAREPRAKSVTIPRAITRVDSARCERALQGTSGLAASSSSGPCGHRSSARGHAARAPGPAADGWPPELAVSGRPHRERGYVASPAQATAGKPSSGTRLRVASGPKSSAIFVRRSAATTVEAAAREGSIERAEAGSRGLRTGRADARPCGASSRTR